MLHEPDVKAIIRLLGEASILEEDLAGKKRFLLSGLCDLINADTWKWSLQDDAVKRKSPRYLARMSGGPSKYQGYGENSLTALKSVAVKQPTGSRLVLTVQQITDDNAVSTISMARQEGRRPFARREIKMAQIVLSEIPWLHEKNPSPETKSLGMDLSPRKRATLIYLVDGLGRQAIADKLRISAHTVHGYIKEIYRHHRINSRAELLKQFTALRRGEPFS